MMNDDPNYDDDLLLYTMEKVGTTTVMNTVKSAGIPINRATRLTIRDINFEFKQIITIARDPIEWAISYYLEMPDAHPRDIKDYRNFGTVENFHLNVSPMYPESWFIHQFREIIGVNLFSKWFRKGRGWEIFSINRVLVLLTHRLSDTLNPGLSELTGRPESDFTLHPHERIMGINRFGATYKMLYKEVRYPRLWLIDNVLEGKYCKHFFSIYERQEMLDRWAK